MKSKILIVDDNQENLIICTKVLEELEDLEIFCVESAEDALVLIEVTHFDIAIIDVVLPNMDGYELAREIRKDEKHTALPMIFISAVFADDEHVHQAYRAGAVDFIRKPFSFEILLGKVQNFLKLEEYRRKLEILVEERTRELQDSLNSWQQTFDAIEDSIVIIDMNFEIIQANKATFEKFGDSIIGKKCFEVFHGSSTPMHKCPCLGLKDADNSLNEGANPPTCEVGDLEMSVFPIKDRKGEIVQYVHVARDISARKTMEHQLRHSEKMLAVGQLAGGVAHDFNNQLTAILGYATLLKDKVEDDKTLTKFANTIIRATHRSADLTKKLLAFARKGMTQNNPTDIHELLSETGELCSRTINKKVNLILDLKARSFIVNGDPSQLGNAFLNLGINANDAMEEGGKLTISTENVAVKDSVKVGDSETISEGKYISLKFSDTGSGIDDEVKKHIFEPFYSTKGEKGTGLGLAAVYGTVKAHQGVIYVESVIGEGTTFSILFPVVSEKSDSPDETLIFLDDAKDTHSNSSLILIVDDEDLVRNFAEEVITTLGHSVISCSSGREAVDIFSRKWKEVDLVILDMMMPDMNGKDTFVELKKINPEVKVVFASGYSDINATQSLIDDNLTSIMNKPFDIKAISDKLKQMLN